MTTRPVYSVNDLIVRLPQLHGQEVQVAGILFVEFEGSFLWHHPGSERWPNLESALLWEHDFEFLRTPRDDLHDEFHGRYVEVTALVDHTPAWCSAGRLRIRRIVDLGVGECSPWPRKEPPRLPWRERLRADRVRRRRGISWDHKLRGRIRHAWARRPRIASLRNALIRRRIRARISWLEWKRRVGRWSPSLRSRR